MTTPDVTVVVPVYNTMPYLTRCLESLIRQSIGLDRMEIIAVNDGSSDGSGRELDRYARRYPGVVTVIHQANSGGPAGPCNRALDVASGRYVFFVGADDHLGLQALERLVTTADAYGSDVVAGKVVGVHGRFIYQDIFTHNAIDVDLFDSPLPRSLANTKLFRRSLLEQHGIRYREDFPMGSDLPFTLEACYHAGRISVLSDYEFYYAVRRHSASNITYVSRHLDRLAFVERTAAFIADLIEPGKQRDAILARRFDHEIAKLLDDDFLALDRAAAQTVADGVGRVVAAHLNDDIAAELNAQTRLRLAIARDGSLDDLLALIRQDAEVGLPATMIDRGRRYAAYPGFRTPGGLPDACFDVTSSPDWPVKLDTTAVSWPPRGDRLVITARTPISDLSAYGVDRFSVSAEEIPAATRIIAADSSGTTVEMSFRISELLHRSDATGRRRSVLSQPGEFDVTRALGAVGAAGVAPVRAPKLGISRPHVAWRGAHPYAIAAVKDGSGRLMIAVTPLTFSRVWAKARREIKRRGGGPNRG